MVSVEPEEAEAQRAMLADVAWERRQSAISAVLLAGIVAGAVSALMIADVMIGALLFVPLFVFVPAAAWYQRGWALRTGRAARWPAWWWAALLAAAWMLVFFLTVVANELLPSVVTGVVRRDGVLLGLVLALLGSLPLSWLVGLASWWHGARASHVQESAFEKDISKRRSAHMQRARARQP